MSMISTILTDLQRSLLIRLPLARSRHRAHGITLDLATSIKETSIKIVPLVLGHMTSFSPLNPPSAFSQKTSEEKVTIEADSLLKLIRTQDEGLISLDGVASTAELRELCFPSTSFAINGMLPSSWTRPDSSTLESSGYARQNRSLERLESSSFNGDHPEDDAVFRLVTGTIPILKDGSILLISSMKKPQWTLPKGGWELDESITDGAIRETYEEAGVGGILGPPLPTIEYEAGKALKRRLSYSLRQFEPSSPEPTRRPSTDNSVSITIAPPTSVQSTEGVQRCFLDVPATEDSTRVVSGCWSIITPEKGAHKPNSHTHVRMTLFPLYVLEVYDAWPESARFRKAVSIDEAIDEMINRPEFAKALGYAKESMLHFP